MPRSATCPGACWSARCSPLPVAFAVMAHELFGATWLPELLLNRWAQLALITPVMFYTGWPIHRWAGSRCATARRR